MQIPDLPALGTHLAHAGLTGITASTDEYHQERVALANISRALEDVQTEAGDFVKWGRARCEKRG